MVEPTRVRCAVYTRKSSEEGLEQSFNSLHAQREACEAYVLSQKHEGWILIPTAYDDGGFSGGSMERPGLKALLADLDAGLIDAVVVYKVDRLTRSLADFAKMVDRFDAKAVSFVSVTQAFNTTTSMGRLTLNVLLSFAQFEREVTGERIRDKIAASKAKGMWMGGAVPLGYDVADRKLVVNEAEAEQVRLLFQLYLDHRSVDDVIALAAERGITTKVRTSAKGVTGGTKLGRGSLYSMLANPVYAGEISHKGKRYPGEHQAIVDPAVFAEAEGKLARNRRPRKEGGNTLRASILSGRVFDDTGSRLTATHTRKGKRVYRYYSGAGRRVPAPELEQLIGDTLAARLATPTGLAQLLPDLELLTTATISSASKAAATLVRGMVDQARLLLMELVKKVVVSDTAMTATIELAPIGISNVVTLTVAATIARPKDRLTLVLPGGAAQTPDPALVTMVAQARDWFGQIAVGTPSEAIARAENVTSAYVRQIVGAAFMAPDLIRAIVEGRHPVGLGSDRLRAMLPLPSDWNEQRALFASL
jgi:site-specific DNA recombinase